MAITRPAPGQRPVVKSDEEEYQEMRKQLLERSDMSYQTRDSGFMFKGIWLPDANLPLWKCSAGEHLIDIIPYRAGKNDPIRKEGTFTYVLILLVHTNIGVNRDSFVCLAQEGIGKYCPICSYREQLKRSESYDEEFVKTLYPKRRTAYNIICLDNEKEEAKGIQVWEVSHFFMEKHLQAIKKNPKGRSGANVGGEVMFADSREGMSIAFERKGAGADNTSFDGHRFVSREGFVIPKETLAQAFILDEFLYFPTVEEMKDSVHGQEEPQSTDAPQEVSTGGEETKEAPVGRRPKPPVEEVATDCPQGGTFGVDVNKFDECMKSCTKWNECSLEKDKLDADVRREEAPPPARRPSPEPTSRSRQATVNSAPTGRRRLG